MKDFSFVEEQRIGGSRYFTLTGIVHINGAAFMEGILGKAVKDGCDHIIINMSLVSLFSSAAIRVVLSVYKKMRHCGGTLQIENPSENVRNVIGMTALDAMLLI